MTYQINGGAMICFPQSQHWIDAISGYDHTGRPILAATRSVELSFDQTRTTNYAYFSAFNGTSLTSIQLLGIDSGSYTVFSNTGINLQIKDRPNFEAGYTTRFVVLVTGIIA